MTKKIRIENADTSSFKVKVTAQDKNTETGEWADVPGAPAVNLNNPAQLSELYLTSTRRFIVEEASA